MLRNRIVIYSLAMSSIFGICISASHGATIISNLDTSNGNSSTNNLSSIRSKGMGFAMPAGVDYSLDDVTLRLRFVTSTSNPVVQLWSNSATNQPLSPMITLNNPAFVSTAGLPANYDFTPPTPFTLHASTKYWLVVYRGETGFTFNWDANDPPIVPSGIATHFGARFDGNGPPPTVNSTILNSYAIDATPIPEPSTISIAAILATAALRLVRRSSGTRCR